MPDDQPGSPTESDLTAAALAGLSTMPKRLSPKWLYDEAGSALFEQITELPEYYLTRAEAEILRDNAAELAALVPEGGALVELGAGASIKTRALLDAGHQISAYVPIDISEEFLLTTAATLRQHYPAIAVEPVVADFTAAPTLPKAVRERPKVGFFPGSTIGNLAEEEAVALLTWARDWPGVQAFILGADLVKDEATLVAAYDDAAGVTAAFNLNLLTRLNREAGADFDPGAFVHEARWMGDRIEMHLVASSAQTVTLAGQRIPFAAGESIHTESCRKYTDATLAALARAAGWRVETTLTDGAQRFAVAILRPGSPDAQP
ncbi:MAG: L-histidine N(alpha)-methyltransferase [Pseudomonadota bacterium]